MTRTAGTENRENSPYERNFSRHFLWCKAATLCIKRLPSEKEEEIKNVADGLRRQPRDGGHRRVALRPSNPEEALQVPAAARHTQNLSIHPHNTAKKKKTLRPTSRSRNAAMEPSSPDIDMWPMRVHELGVAAYIHGVVAGIHGHELATG